MSKLENLDRLPDIVRKREELCNSDGGSPSRLHDLSCFTDQLFTGRKIPYYSYCGMTSMKSMRNSRVLPRRVELFSSKNSTKAVLRFLTIFFTSFFSVINLFSPVAHLPYKEIL